jgi:hypothetical protein
MSRLARAWRKRTHCPRRWEPSGAGGSACEIPLCLSLSMYVDGTPIVVVVCAHASGDLGDTDNRNDLPVQLGYGLSLWSRVATAASTLTMNVSKASDLKHKDNCGARMVSYLNLDPGDLDGWRDTLVGSTVDFPKLSSELSSQVSLACPCLRYSS